MLHSVLNTSNYFTRWFKLRLWESAAIKMFFFFQNLSWKDLKLPPVWDDLVNRRKLHWYKLWTKPVRAATWKTLWRRFLKATGTESSLFWIRTSSTLSTAITWLRGQRGPGQKWEMHSMLQMLKRKTRKKGFQVNFNLSSRLFPHGRKTGGFALTSSATIIMILALA